MSQATAPLRVDEIEDRITLTVEEVAVLLELGRTAAYEATRRGEILTCGYVVAGAGFEPATFWF